MVRSTAMTTVAAAVTAAVTGALAAGAVCMGVGCGGGGDKPPLTPDGPDMTAPIGDDAGSGPVTPAQEIPMNAPSSPKGGIESQTTIGH